MIYSSDHKFLMLKNIKVGGTSLEVELSQVLPKNAIVTEITPANKKHMPRNNKGFYNHMPYTEIEQYINLSDVKSYVFVRHPYDLILSMFFYRLYLKNINWEMLNKIEQEKILYKYFFGNDDSLEILKSTKTIYSKDNKIIVNDVLKYEDGIEKSINPILSKHDIKNISMNTFEKQHRPKKYTIHNTFKEEHLEQIYNEWKWEFDQFGYTA